MAKTKEELKELKQIIIDSQLFEDASEYVLNLIANKVEVKKFKKNDPVFLENEDSYYVYILKKGAVSIQASSKDGTQSWTVHSVKELEHFSEFSVLSNSKHSTSAFAKVDSELILIEGSLFLEIIQDNHNLSIKLISQLSRKIHQHLSSSFSVRPFNSEDLDFNKAFNKVLPMNFISKYKVIPIFFENNNLHLALTLPFKTDFFKAFEQLNTKVNLQLYTISENEFEYLRKPIMNAYLGREDSINLHNSPNTISDDSEVVDFLTFSLPFSQIPKEILLRITEASSIVEYKKGQVIARANNPVNKFYIVKSGKVNLTKKVGDQPLSCHIETLKTYDSFAEVSIITNSWMSLTATAATDCKIVEVPRTEFEKLLKSTDFTLPLAIHLSTRLQHLNKLPGIQLNLENETQLTSITEITTVHGLMEEHLAPKIQLQSQDSEQLLKEILSFALTERSSDIHIEFNETETIIRCRIDGILNQLFFQSHIVWVLV